MAKQIRFVTADKLKEGQIVASVAVFDADGAPVDMSDLGGGAAYTLPAATAAALGGVKQAAAVADVAADADAAALATAFNGLLAALRAAGIVAEA